MSFIWPFMLVCLLIIPVLVIVYLRVQRRRQQAASRFSGFGYGPAATAANGPGFRRHIPPLLFLIGLTILIVALARPQMPVSLPRVQGTVILAFDVSGSMAADDLKPTRMEAAKAAARSFIEHQPPSVQVGVVAFSDNGFAIQAPTNDQDTLLAAINRLTPQRGTSLAQGINASLNTIAAALADKPIGDTSGEPAHLSAQSTQPTPSPTPVPRGTYKSAVVILLTDGENNENPDPQSAAQTAADQGVRIYTVGIGSPEGATLKINGFTVRTRLDEEMLQQIAQTTSGAYFNAQSAQDLQNIYNSLSPQLIIKAEQMEVTSIFAGASILFLLAASLFSLLWFARLP